MPTNISINFIYIFVLYKLYNMQDEKKRSSWLLTDVPEDIKKIVRDQQEKKKNECGCRYGRGQAIYNLLRKAYGAKDITLQDAKN